MTDITSFDFQEDLKFSDSYVEQGTSFPNATSYTSDIFEIGKVQGALALKIVANGAVVIGNGKTLTIELYYEDAETDAFTANSVTLLSYTNSTGSGVTRADGYEFVNYIPGTDILKFGKIKITTDEDLSSYDFDAYLAYQAR